MRPDDVVNALAKVPETKLRLLELAWELATPDGTLDVQQAALRIEEVERAREQAHAYGQATQRALRRLPWMGP